MKWSLLVFVNFKRNLLGVVLTLFVASLIVFDVAGNVVYNNLMNILFFMLFTVIFLLEKDYEIPIPDIAVAYLFFAMFAFASMFWAYDSTRVLSFSMRLLVVSLNFFILYIVFERYNLEKTILYGILIGGLYNILIGLNVIHVNYEIFQFGRLMGSVGNSNKLAKIMILSIFASLIFLSTVTTKTWFKIYNYINIILSFYIIVLTVSKKAMILTPLLIMLSFSFKHLKVRNIVMFLILLVVGYQLFITYGDVDQLTRVYGLIESRFLGMIDTLHGQSGDASTVEREYLLHEGFGIFADHPLFGTGLNNFRYFLENYAHNNYLELLVGVGIIGASLYYTIYVLTIRNIYKMPNSIIKRYFYVMVFILLALDVATVTYFTKPLLFLLLYIYYVARKSSEEINLKRE
jgi:O-antigen ligase